MSSSKLITWFFYLLMGISILIGFAFFVFKSESANDGYTDSLLYLSYGLVVIAILATFALEIFSFVKLMIEDTKTALKGLIGIGCMIAIVLVSWAMADGTPMEIIGYTSTGNTPGWNVYTDTVLISTYILIVAAIITWISTNVIRLVR